MLAYGDVNDTDEDGDGDNCVVMLALRMATAACCLGVERAVDPGGGVAVAVLLAGARVLGVAGGVEPETKPDAVLLAAAARWQTASVAASFASCACRSARRLALRRALACARAATSSLAVVGVDGIPVVLVVVGVDGILLVLVFERASLLRAVAVTDAAVAVAGRADSPLVLLLDFALLSATRGVSPPLIPLPWAWEDRSTPLVAPAWP